MGKELRLTDEELAELRIIVERHWENARVELRRSRRLEFRDELKTELHVVESLCRKVQEACAQSV